MSSWREGEATMTAVKRTSGAIRDVTLTHIVKMEWTGEDRTLLPFRLVVDGQVYLLSWRELSDMDRGGFFRREGPGQYRLRYFDGPKIIFNVDLNEEAERDVMVLIRGPSFEIMVDWYQMLRVGRFI